MNAPAQSTYREVVDDNGRVYRVGETDRDILGRSRAWMVWLPWISMMAISSSEYAFTSAEDTLSEAHGWHGAHIFWLLGVWVMFQAAVAFPVGQLRESGTHEQLLAHNGGYAALWRLQTGERAMETT